VQAVKRPVINVNTYLGGWHVQRLKGGNLLIYFSIHFGKFYYF